MLRYSEQFQNAKTLTMRISETYRSFGIDAFGFGVSYGKNPNITLQPVIVPAAILGHHLEHDDAAIDSPEEQFEADFSIFSAEFAKLIPALANALGGFSELLALDTAELND